MTNKKPKIYLAGPDVFLPDPLGMAKRKKDIMDRYGLEGCHPFDNEIDFDPAQPAQTALRIKDANCAMMRTCDAILAHVTPFRGPSADVGTAYEIGFMEALGKPVYLYSNDTDPYMERVRKWNGGQLREQDGMLRDRFSMSVENFGLSDNLMFGAGMGGKFWAAGAENPYDSLDAFEKAARQMAQDFGLRPAAPKFTP